MTTAASGFTSSSQRCGSAKPSKKGDQYGSFCSPLAIARPMDGTWVDPSPPTMRAMSVLRRREQLRLELVDRQAGLHGADVLHIESEDTGEFRQVIGVAAQLEQLQQVTLEQRLGLLRGHAVARAIARLVFDECVAIGGVVERKAQLVQRIAPLRQLRPKNRRTDDLVVPRGLCCGFGRALSHAPMSLLSHFREEGR